MQVLNFCWIKLNVCRELRMKDEELRTHEWLIKDGRFLDRHREFFILHSSFSIPYEVVVPSRSKHAVILIAFPVELA
jgi:hypothetical protein